MRVIDLFAGIGGMRLAFGRVGAHCVFSSEWDRFAQQTYAANFGGACAETPFGDIRDIDVADIPDHDVLLAGFPCQPFSIAGVSKKKSLGRAHGFGDRTQGNLFFEIARILEAKRPPALLLENVRNLKTHDGGRTFRIIRAELQRLGYRVHHRVLDAQGYVPQHRQRIFIVGFRRDLWPDLGFSFPDPPAQGPSLADILEAQVDGKYTLSDKLWQYLQAYTEKHRRRGNGFGFGLVDPARDRITRTLSARYYKDGSEILIKQGGRNPRRLTPRECARLMGFPDDFVIPVSDTQAYRQFGNSVVVPLVEDIARAMQAWHAAATTMAREGLEPGVFVAQERRFVGAP
ncbi:MAG: DNA (cytosine-5-)-methyltransferase [Anaerolineaceae bacterium]|nr:DNA (cytosine-5-)-methyltransferase [Anaerolineaceae bacterium]